MPSQYTIFKPPRQSTPEPEESSGGFLGNLFGGSEEPVQQQSTSQYTIFKPPRVNTVQEEQPKKPFFEQYRSPASYITQKYQESPLKEVGGFGMQALTSGLGSFTKGITSILSLSKTLPRKAIQALDRPFFGQPDTQKFEEVPWVKKTLENYESAFDLAKGLKPVSYTENTGDKVDIFTEAIPRAIGKTAGMTPGIFQLITKGQDSLKKEFEPEFSKDPNFIQNYSNASTVKKITQYPKETLRLMAPDVIGSGLGILGTTIVTGGTGLGSLVLSAATGEDVKQTAIKNGVDEQKAETLGIATAIPVMFLEKFGFDTILGKGALANVGTSFGGKILKSAITEAGTESTQELWQAAMENTFKEVSTDEYANRIGMAALGGALGGALFGSASSMIDTISGKYDAKSKAQAEQRLEGVIQESPKKSIIEQGLDYKPTENSVLKQDFVDSLTKDVLQQTEMITDPKVKQRSQKAINGLRTKEYSNIREFEVELAKQLPKNVEPVTFEQTAIGQDFNKAIANTDDDMRVIMIQRAFEQKGPKGQRIPLPKESITAVFTGSAAAPQQNIIGDTISRMNEEKDKILEEAPNDPKAKQAVARAQVVVDQLQKAYNIQNAQEVIRQVKEEQATTQVGKTADLSQTAQAPNTPIQRTGMIPTLPIQGTRKARSSGLASKVEAKAIEKGLVDSFGQLPAFTSVNMPEQAAMAANLVNNDIEKAKRIAYGEELPPNNMLLGSVFKAVESYALKNNDIDTLQKLGTQSTVSLEASALGQQLQAFKEIDQTSPIAVMSEVKKQRTKNAEIDGKNVTKETKQTVKEIDAEIKKQKVKPKDWSEFIENLSC